MTRIERLVRELEAHPVLLLCTLPAEQVKAF